MTAAITNTVGAGIGGFLLLAGAAAIPVLGLVERHTLRRKADR